MFLLCFFFLSFFCSLSFPCYFTIVPEGHSKPSSSSRGGWIQSGVFLFTKALSPDSSLSLLSVLPRIQEKIIFGLDNVRAPGASERIFHPGRWYQPRGHPSRYLSLPRERRPCAAGKSQCLPPSFCCCCCCCFSCCFCCRFCCQILTNTPCCALLTGRIGLPGLLHPRLSQSHIRKSSRAVRLNTAEAVVCSGVVSRETNPLSVDRK